MGILAPLYFAGIVLVGLPILFHLIRRHPQGKQAFSSLMFLQPSPPRLTKRSRLDNLLLLILRATAVILLAIAFARPFLNNLMASDKMSANGRKIALLIDQSASMQRADLWEQAQKKADEFLKTITPADQVALFLFDDQVHPALGFDQWNKAEPSERVKLLKLQLASAKPTYAGTKLGDALANVAGQLSEIDPANRASDTMPRMIELISDLQKGGNAEALQGHEWPANVVLKAEPVAVAADKKTNASLQWVTQTTEEGTNDDRLRVWVNNDAASAKDQFTLTWADKDGPIPGADPLKVYVPAGHKQIVRVPWPQTPAQTAPASRAAPQQSVAGAQTRMAEPPRTPDRLVLSGDDFDFDNTLFVVAPRLDTFKVLYLGDDAANNVEGMLYYLASDLADTPRRQATLISRPHEAVPEDADFAVRLVVVADAPNEATVAKLQKFLDNGGNVLWVMKDAQVAGTLGKVLGLDSLEAREAQTNFSLISDVDTTHPLFAPFAEARFGDFTKIHFWHHRVVEVTAADATTPKVNVLARFDDQSPFVLERGVGKGWVRILTSSWSPSDSQFALSTKFVPLMEGFLKRRDEVAVASQYGVHEPVALPPLAGAGSDARAVVMPDGKRIEFGAAATTFDGTDLPGIYQLEMNGGRTPIAVNLPPGESDTAALAPDELAQWGAKLGAPPKSESDKTMERRRQSEDLEKQQKLWRWIILCVLGLLGVETLLAGSLARRAVIQGATT